MDQQTTPNPGAPLPPPAEGPKQKTLLIIATYVLFFIPLFDEQTKKDPFFRFHMRQSLGLLLAWVVSSIIGRLPMIWVVAPFMQLFLIVLWFMAIISACKGKQEPVPVFGAYFQKINI